MLQATAEPMIPTHNFPVVFRNPSQDQQGILARPWTPENGTNNCPSRLDMAVPDPFDSPVRPGYPFLQTQPDQPFIGIGIINVQGQGWPRRRRSDLQTAKLPSVTGRDPKGTRESSGVRFLPVGNQRVGMSFPETVFPHLFRSEIYAR